LGGHESKSGYAEHPKLQPLIKNACDEIHCDRPHKQSSAEQTCQALRPSMPANYSKEHGHRTSASESVLE